MLKCREKVVYKLDLVNSYNNPEKQVLLQPLVYREENWGWEIKHLKPSIKKLSPEFENDKTQDVEARLYSLKKHTCSTLHYDTLSNNLSNSMMRYAFWR